MTPRLFTRFASTTAFPFPTHPRPTAHQIFHLSPNATPKDIKARYYDLVRVHHPDSSHCRLLPHSERQSRFQAITAAYETLLHGSGSKRSPPSDLHRTRYTRYRRDHAYCHPDTASWAHGSDDRWKDWLILVAGFLALVVSLSPGLFLYPSALEKRHRMASANLAKARKDARIFADERRKDVRRRVSAHRLREQQIEEKCPTATT